MEFSIKEYSKYNESEILKLYQSVGWTNYTDNPDMLKILELYQNVYQKSLLTDNTDKTIQFYKSTGFEIDTDIECRAFIKMF